MSSAKLRKLQLHANTISAGVSVFAIKNFFTECTECADELLFVEM